VAETFFVELGDLEEVTIATAGPLELFARCELDIIPQPPPEFGPNPPADTVSLVVTSSIEGWVAGANGFRPQEAGAEVLLNTSGDEIRPTGGPRLAQRAGGIAIAPDGSFIQVPGVGLGANLFDQPGVCLVAGTVVVHESEVE
jgi:hypothetical protein